MLLENQTAIVYGAAGSIGAAVAQAYGREGAHVHLAGRSRTGLDRVAREIRLAGGTAHFEQLDVLDGAAVRRHAVHVTDVSGGIDICFNATSNDDIQGSRLIDLSLEAFMQPVIKALSAHFTIATSVAPHMAHRGGGVILVMGGGREAISGLGGSHVAWAALAGLCRQLAADLGPDGIRLIWLLSPGSPESEDDGDPGSNDHSSGEEPHGLIPRHQPSLAEVGEIATFLASAGARTMTATEVNLTGGAVID